MKLLHTLVERDYKNEGTINKAVIMASKASSFIGKVNNINREVSTVYFP